MHSDPSAIDGWSVLATYVAAFWSFHTSRKIGRSPLSASALLLFGTAWLILVPYYLHFLPTRELHPVIGSVLLVMASIILLRSVRIRTRRAEWGRGKKFQTFATSVLFGIAGPHTLHLVLDPGNSERISIGRPLGLPQPTWDEFYLWIGALFAPIVAWAIWESLKTYQYPRPDSGFPGWKQLSLRVVLILYVLAEELLLVFTQFLGGSTTPLNWAFAFLKIFLAGLIAWEVRCSSERFASATDSDLSTVGMVLKSMDPDEIAAIAARSSMPHDQLTAAIDTAAEYLIARD